jgi:hypothetical protein
VLSVTVVLLTKGMVEHFPRPVLLITLKTATSAVMYVEFRYLVFLGGDTFHSTLTFFQITCAALFVRDRDCSADMGPHWIVGIFL